MKSSSVILFLLVLFASCSPQVKVEETVPDTLEKKRELLKEKQTVLKILNTEIAELEAAIQEQDPNARKKGTLVTTLHIESTDFASYTSLQGSVTADDLLDATAEIAGRITRLNVKEGDLVRKGQLVAVLDVEMIESQRAELQTSLDLASTVFERQQRLWEQNIGSEIQFLQAKNNKDRLEKSLASLDLQLSKNKVYAAGSGVVQRVILQAGELAAPGVPIVQILNVNRLKVTADVPETYINTVRKGNKVEVLIPALGEEYNAVISLVGKVVDPANRTFKAEVNLPTSTSLKPNLLAEMRIQDQLMKDVVVLPLSCIQQEVGGKQFVMTVANAPKGKEAKKSYVTIGDSYNGQVIISSGVLSGEEVIMEGARGLVDGQVIEITNVKSEK